MPLLTYSSRFAVITTLLAVRPEGLREEVDDAFRLSSSENKPGVLSLKDKKEAPKGQATQQYTSRYGASGLNPFDNALEGQEGFFHDMSGKETFDQWKAAKNAETGEPTCTQSYFAYGMGHCPEECGYSTIDPKQHCYFQCVRPEQCGEHEKTFKVADSEDPQKKICRACYSPGCERCRGKAPGQLLNQTSGDTCMKCKTGFELKDGQCIQDISRAWHIFFGVLIPLSLFIVLWYLNMICSPNANEDIYNRAVKTFGRKKIRREGDGHEFYPLSTNLHEVEVAGPGMVLFFDYEWAMIKWLFFVLAGWYMLSAFVGEALNIGSVLEDDRQHYCQMLFYMKDMIYHVQFPKVIFLLITYVVSTMLSIIWFIKQQRKFDYLDAGNVTMVDYCVVLEGFPCESGDQLESEYEAYLRAACPDSALVGVSICWRMLDDPDGLSDAAESLLWQVEARNESIPPPTDPADGCCSRPFQFVDGVLCGIPLPGRRVVGSSEQDSAGDGGDSGQTNNEIRQTVMGLTTTGFAFAIFETEVQRDAALDVLHLAGAPAFRGTHRLQASAAKAEPEGVLWQNFGIGRRERHCRFITGVLVLTLVITLWGVCVYYPYAYFETTYFESIGQAPGFAFDFTFSMMVVVGNQIVYAVCAIIAEKAGFCYDDDREVVFSVTYFLACVINAFTDLGVQGATTFLMMAYSGVKDEEGVPLADLIQSGSVDDFVTAMPVVRMFGRSLYAYNASCFLIPFICEGVFAVVLPEHLGKQIVRTRPMTLKKAESILEPALMDLSRYPDLLVNVTLAVFAFNFNAAFVSKTLRYLLFANLYIYAFDWVKVLRKIKHIKVSSNRMDRIFLKLNVIPCSLILTSAAYWIFYLHKQRGDDYYLKGVSVFQILPCVFFGSMTIHYLLMLMLDHCFDVDKKASAVPYSQLAKGIPASYFNTNPVHCLRSSYLRRHSPPCSLYRPGKEHLLQRNESIGCYYQSGEYKDAENSVTEDLYGLRKEAATAVGRKESSRDAEGPADKDKQS